MCILSILRANWFKECFFFFSALNEAAERFRELQAEKEMRQLQEDRKNDKKPPPYKHIKVIMSNAWLTLLQFDNF